MNRHADREAAENAYGLGSADTQEAIWELLAHYKGGEPENLPGPEEFQECMERHPYADPDRPNRPRVIRRAGCSEAGLWLRRLIRRRA